MRRVGALLAGRDVFALDVVACRLIGVDPMRLSTVSASVRAGLLPERLEEISSGGEELSRLKVDGFRLPDPLSPIGFSPVRIVRSTYRHLRVLLQQRTSEG